MFSYESYGAIKGKRLRVIKTNTFFQSGQYKSQTATGDLNMSYVRDNEGKVTSITYPTDAQAGVTPQYNYQYDAMSRPSGMSDQNAATVVSGVLYGAANELLSMNYDGGTETRSYNAMFQLTGISGLGQNISYNFPAGSNNGKIASQYDAVSGETVSYQYDSLNRLISATAEGWSQSYSYDGFGNLTNRVGSGAAVGNNPTAADPATNRLVNAAYDVNGNMLSTGNVYDVENRLMQAAMAGGTIQYAYDGQNKRIWQGQFTNSGDPQMLMSDTVSMFGADGQLAATYSPVPAFNNTTNPVGITFAQVVQRVYFGRKLIKWLDSAYAAHNAVLDRAGSVGKYYPYGEERNSPTLPNDQVKFATYTRDSATGLDYADQRYYSSSVGRFTTADPYKASGGPNNPGSWNRFSYVQSDPANFNDRSGLFLSAQDCLDNPELCIVEDTEGGGGPDDGGGGGGGGGGPCSLGSQFAPNPSPNPGPYCPAPDPPPPPPPPKPPACPLKIQAFFNDFSAEFIQIAGAIGTSFEDIAAFAAFESNWGNSSHRVNHNLFSELKKTRRGYRMIHWNSFGQEEQYVINRLAKPVDQGGEQGIIDPAAFASQLSAIHWTADPPATYKAGFLAAFAQVLYWEPICLH